MMEYFLYVLVIVASVASGISILWAPPKDRHTTARTEAAPLFFGFFSLTSWALVAYGASSIDILDRQQGTITEGATSEPGIIVLAVGCMLLSLLVIVAAATESFPTEVTDAADARDRFSP